MGRKFLSHPGDDAYDQEVACEEQDESMADIEPPPLKTKTFQEAIQSLENVQHFLDVILKHIWQCF